MGWYHKSCISTQHIPLIFLGCKSDLRISPGDTDASDIGREWAPRDLCERMAETIGADLYMECSAKEDLESVRLVIEESVRAGLEFRKGVNLAFEEKKKQEQGWIMKMVRRWRRESNQSKE